MSDLSILELKNQLLKLVRENSFKFNHFYDPRKKMQVILISHKNESKPTHVAEHQNLAQAYQEAIKQILK